jgi:hypothetical protein
MIVGNPAIFAIESGISQVFAGRSNPALGYFVIHLRGNAYGVRSPDATMLGCSFDAVVRRLAQRGEHRADFGAESTAADIADAVLAAEYDGNRQHESFFGMPADELRDLIHAGNIQWAPDGDEAFDDGSNVIHFDHGEQVRLIAFGNSDYSASSLAELWMPAADFYALLDEWRQRFEAEVAALSTPRP